MPASRATPARWLSPTCSRKRRRECEGGGRDVPRLPTGRGNRDVPRDRRSDRRLDDGRAKRAGKRSCGTPDYKEENRIAEAGGPGSVRTKILPVSALPKPATGDREGRGPDRSALPRRVSRWGAVSGGALTGSISPSSISGRTTFKVDPSVPPTGDPAKVPAGRADRASNAGTRTEPEARTHSSHQAFTAREDPVLWPGSRDFEDFQ